RARLPVIGQNVQVVTVLRHTTAHAPDLLERVVDPAQAAQRTRMLRSVRVREHVIVEIVDVDRRGAGIEIARDGEREQLAHPYRQADLDGQPLPAAAPLPDRIGEQAQYRAEQLGGRDGRALEGHPPEDDERRERGEETTARGPLHDREREQIVDGAAGEHAAIAGAAVEDAAPAGRLRLLDSRGVAGAWEIDVLAVTL